MSAAQWGHSHPNLSILKSQPLLVCRHTSLPFLKMFLYSLFGYNRGANCERIDQTKARKTTLPPTVNLFFSKACSKQVAQHFRQFRVESEMENRTEPSDEFMATESDSVPGRPSASPRLFIKEMVMRNFKSYAGEQRVGPFHKVRVSTVHLNLPLSVSAVNFVWFLRKSRKRKTN